MNDAVKDVAEETTTVDSQPTEATSVEAEAQTDTQPAEQSDESSGDVITSEGESGDDVVDEAQAEVKSPRGQNRVQELANRLKEAEAKLAEYEGNVRSQQPMTQEQAQVQQNQMAQIRAYKEQLMADKVNFLEQKQMFQELEQEYPELNPKSEAYSKEFDDFVYESYQLGRDPREAAENLRRLVKLGESKGVSARQETEDMKSTEQSRSVRRSGVSEQSLEQESARKRFSKTGSFDDLLKIKLD